jgi:hypothetical protein
MQANFIPNSDHFFFFRDFPHTPQVKTIRSNRILSVVSAFLGFFRAFPFFLWFPFTVFPIVRFFCGSAFSVFPVLSVFSVVPFSGKPEPRKKRKNTEKTERAEIEGAELFAAWRGLESSRCAASAFTQTSTRENSIHGSYRGA